MKNASAGETLTSVVRAALDAGAKVYHLGDPLAAPPSNTESARRARFAVVRAKLFAVLQKLPDDMTVAELRDALRPGDLAAEGAREATEPAKPGDPIRSPPAHPD